MTDPTQARMTLSFQTPSGLTGDANAYVTATDVLGCSSTVGFGLNFTDTPVSSVPSARIRFDTNGDGAFEGSTPTVTVETESREISLDALESSDDEGLENLTFLWTLNAPSGLATLSPVSGPTTTLKVDPVKSGNVTVTLTAADSQGQSGQASVTFSVLRTGPTADFLVIPPSVESGSEFRVIPKAVSGGGGGQFQYDWSAEDEYGQAISVCACGGIGSALVTAPILGEAEESRTLTVTVVAIEDGMASVPVTREVIVRRPTLYFSQLAVGAITDSLEFQTTIALVNDTEETVNAVGIFANNEAGADWSVVADGTPASTLELSLPAGASRIITLTGDEVAIGWMSLTSDAPLTGYLFYRVANRQTGRPVSEVPVLPTNGTHFRTALGPGQNQDVAIALVNTGDSPTQFRIVVKEFPVGDEGADMTLATQAIELGPKQHLAQFLNELMADDGPLPIPASFSGVLFRLKWSAEARCRQPY